MLIGALAQESDEEKLKTKKVVLFYTTPFGIIFLIGWATLRLAPFIPKIGYEVGKFIVTFTKTLFILVHSRELVLVSVDTAMGVTFIYLIFVRQGNPVLGAGPTLVISGFISVLMSYFLDYQLLSRRILHLNNQKA